MTGLAATFGPRSPDVHPVERTNSAGAVVRIASIKPSTRHRRDMGDIDGLARSIADVGLLHPVVINKDGVLIAGERRLKACAQLGWTDVPVTIVDVEEIVRGELAENTNRKDFLPSEIDAIRRAMEPVEKTAAKQRMITAHTSPGNFPEQAKGEVRDKIGAFAGISGRTVEKIAKVIEAAEAEPDKFGHLVEQMDETGKVDHAFKVVNRVRRHNTIAAEAGNAAVLEHPGPFPLIYADPPWKFEVYSEKGLDRTADQHYPTLTDQEIINFKIDGKTVPEIAYRDAALFLWCTSSNLLRALAIVTGWGFTYKTNAIWDKQRTGTGLVFMNMHEHLLYCVRGNMPAPRYLPPSIFRYPRGEHSAKPLEIRAEIEKMYPAFDVRKRLELFARSKPAGWSAYGLEAFDRTPTPSPPSAPPKLPPDVPQPRKRRQA